MKSIRETTAWERVMVRYFSTYMIPIKWDYASRSFKGIAGYRIMRNNPKKQTDFTWTLVPQKLKQYAGERSNGKPPIIIMTNKQYGDSIDDMIVVMNLGTFMPMLKEWYQADPERNKEDVTSN
tara:strand:- start:127 stop:495 length:369 start_codon:yes stop_codon:yes gene_type:complete